MLKLLDLSIFGCNRHNAVSLIVPSSIQVDTSNKTLAIDWQVHHHWTWFNCMVLISRNLLAIALSHDLQSIKLTCRVWRLWNQCLDISLWLVSRMWLQSIHVNYKPKARPAESHPLMFAHSWYCKTFTSNIPLLSLHVSACNYHWRFSHFKLSPSARTKMMSSIHIWGYHPNWNNPFFAKARKGLFSGNNTQMDLLCSTFGEKP